MKLLNSTLRLALLISFLAPPIHLAAADQKKKPEGVPPPADQQLKSAYGASDEVRERAVASNHQVKEIHWDGLPLAEVVKVLRREFPDINFVVPTHVQGESVSLEMRNATLDQIFKALLPATEGRVCANWNQNDRLVVFDRAERPVSVGPDGLPLTDRPQCRVFNINKILAGKSKEEAEKTILNIREAVEIALRMLREASPPREHSGDMPKLYLHSGTKLLIVTGDSADVRLVEQIVEALQGSASTMALTPADLNPELKSKNPSTNVSNPRARGQ